MNRLGLMKLLERYKSAEDKRKFVKESIDEILEILYLLKFKIDKLYEATQVMYDKRSKIVRVYIPVRKNTMLGYFSKHIGLQDDETEIMIGLLKDVVELLKDCKELKELDCNEFLKAFHRYV